jgi:hypothetical protein
MIGLSKLDQLKKSHGSTWNVLAVIGTICIAFGNFPYRYFDNISAMLGSVRLTLCIQS